jgi:hypothetical protein
MKDVRILALTAMLAFGFALSAQAQTENTTDSDQYSTQSTQTTPATTTDSNSMSQDTGTTSEPASATQNSEKSSQMDSSQPQTAQQDDYSKNPYWSPQQWDYINNSIIN